MGIDIGGNHVKIAVINIEGQIFCLESFDTDELRRGQGFMFNFAELAARCLSRDNDIAGLGIGLPGTLDKTRTIPAEIPAIPELVGIRFHETLSLRFPHLILRIENDANLAALGEYRFSPEPLPSSFIMITTEKYSTAATETLLNPATCLRARVKHWKPILAKQE